MTELALPRARARRKRRRPPGPGFWRALCWVVWDVTKIDAWRDDDE